MFQSLLLCHVPKALAVASRFHHNIISSQSNKESCQGRDELIDHGVADVKKNPSRNIVVKEAA